MPSTTATGSSTYVVKRGDNLTRIARAHRTSVSAIARLNNMSSRQRIYPGQVLRVPGAAGEVSGSDSFTYVVKRGDNLSRIARRFGIRVVDILRLNKLSNPERLAEAREKWGHLYK